MRTVKTVIRLGGYPGWSKSSLGAQIILLVFSRCGSNYIGLSTTVNTLKLEHQKTAVFILRVEQLGDNCIQKIYLGRYIIVYMDGNFIYDDVISDHITNDIPPQMKILNMVIPILMHFLTFICQRHSILHQT